MEKIEVLLDRIKGVEFFVELEYYSVPRRFPVFIGAADKNVGITAKPLETPEENDLITGDPDQHIFCYDVSLAKKKHDSPMRIEEDLRIFCDAILAIESSREIIDFHGIVKKIEGSYTTGRGACPFTK